MFQEDAKKMKKDFKVDNTIFDKNAHAEINN